jgi:homospermidine synthase
VAAAYNVALTVPTVTTDNDRSVLGSRLKKGDFPLNLSVGVSSVALVKMCREIGALYLDSCVEPWAGGYNDPSPTTSERSHYALRESALALVRPGVGDPTAVTMLGANPGLVSHLVKQALLNIAADTGADATVPPDQAAWAALANTLGIQVMHIAERDTQTADLAKKPDESCPWRFGNVRVVSSVSPRVNRLVTLLPW